MFATIVLLILSTSPLLISSLQCNVCREPVRVNYIVTKSNVPALPSNCTAIEASVCWASIFWALDFNQTQLEFRARPESNATVEDMVSARLMKVISSDNKTLELVQEVNYECQSSNSCNGQAGIQKVLSALTIEDKHDPELAALLKPVNPFHPREADCAYIHNTTIHCPAPDFQHCHRCTIEAGISATAANEYVCATCPPEGSIGDNGFERYSNFVVNNRTKDFSVAGLRCQLHACNSIENVNLVFKGIEIQFNNEEYFK